MVSTTPYTSQSYTTLSQTNDADVRNEKELTAPTIYSHYESTVSQDDRKGTKDAKMRI